MGTIANLLHHKYHVCPWWLCFTFDNPFRTLIHDPREILTPLVKSGDSVLDLGPGMGYFTFPLSDIVGKKGCVYAADIQKEMLQHIENKKNRYDYQNIKTYLIKKNIDINEKFDLVLMFWMFHEVQNKDDLLSDITDRLKANGRVLLVEPKLHVSKRSFKKELELAVEHNLQVEGYPEIALSNSALFKKDSSFAILKKLLAKISK
jgi:ubiquinone/menaquinone biosynthesis C-methylase UbiE